jgi:hypothetical protein
MFYEASNISSDHRTSGRMYVYRETCVSDLEAIRRDLVQKQLIVVPFAPNPPMF